MGILGNVITLEVLVIILIGCALLTLIVLMKLMFRDFRDRKFEVEAPEEYD